MSIAVGQTAPDYAIESGKKEVKLRISRGKRTSYLCGTLWTGARRARTSMPASSMR